MKVCMHIYIYIYVYVYMFNCYYHHYLCLLSDGPCLRERAPLPYVQ